MIKLWFAPRTRSVRIAWLLEELEVPYELVHVEFVPTKDTFFAQATPTGKLPTIEDDGVTLSESGAILEYVLERYGDGRLAPAVGSRDRGEFLQWLHFAEGTAYPPVGIVVWMTLYRDDAGKHPELLADARERAARGLTVVERALADREYLVGNAFSAADVMMGFTVAAAATVGVLDERHPALQRYFERLVQRPALTKVLSIA